jgi:hypothetical protein
MSDINTKIKFIGNYINYNENKIMYSSKIHNSLDSVKCDLNFIISCFIKDSYNIFITDDFLFLQNPLNVNINITQSINIDEFTSLIFIKNGLVIDIFYSKKEKGYIYGSNAMSKHLYKFYIIKFYENKIEDQEQIPKFCDPSSLSNTYNQQKFNSNLSTTYNIINDLEEIEEIEEIKEPKKNNTSCHVNLKNNLILELKHALNLREKLKLD